MKTTNFQLLDSNARGTWAEQFAEWWLAQQGLEPHSKNYHRRVGELDLVLRDKANRSWVFVEVKYRKRNSLVTGVESITAAKRRRLWRTARLFLQRANDQVSEARIDVLLITPCETALPLSHPSMTSSALSFCADGHRQQIVNGHHLQWIQNAIDGT